MFLGSLNLALLSLCYVNSNNTITQTQFDINPSFNTTYGVYTLGFRGFTDNELLLRYDNQDLMRITTIAEPTYVGVYIDINQSVNLSCYVNINDHNVNEYVSFDCVRYSGDGWYGVKSFSIDADDYDPTYIYWNPDLFFSIRLIADSTLQYTSPNAYGEGYAAGYYQGNNAGYSTGYTEGYDLGNTEGYTSGFETGSASGYQQGYTDAMANHDFTFTNLFGSIADTPILMIRRLFGFELFGVGLISVFMSLFTALIVIHLIKKVF